MRVKEKLVSTLRGILEYVYRNPWMFGFEIALLAGVIIFFLFDRRKTKEKTESSDSSESSNDFL